MNFLLQLFVPKLIKLLLDEAEDSLNDKDKPECTDVGAKLSSHRFGTGFDLEFYDATPEQVQNDIVRHQSEYPTISRMENATVTVTWLHIEVTKYRNNNIYVFKP